MKTVVTKRRVHLYVNRATLHWVVRDEKGNYWVLPHGDRPWERREPAGHIDQLELESVPGHYIHMLGIPIAIE